MESFQKFGKISQKMESVNEVAKNIVVFNKDVPAGVSTILKNVIQYSCATDGAPFRLVLYHYDGTNHHFIEEDWCKDVIRVKLNHDDNLFYTIKKLSRFVAKDSIIVANDLPELRMAALLNLPNPLIYIIHGDFEIYYRHCEQFQDYMDLIISYSSHIKKKLEQFLKPENRKKIKLIYYPVPAIEIAGRNPETEEIKLLFVGSLIERKGVDLLPGIIKGLDDLQIPYLLKIVGSGKKEQWLKEKFSGNNRVLLTGQQSYAETIKVYSRSDILLFPTRSEGLPNVLVEAMKAGCVPIVSDIPSGIPDLVDYGKNGFLIPVNDVDAFVNTIATLYHAHDYMSKMSQAAIRTSNKMFDPYENASAYYDAFLGVPSKKNKLKIKIKKGPILNRSFLPNFLVRTIRKFRINPNL